MKVQTLGNFANVPHLPMVSKPCGDMHMMQPVAHQVVTQDLATPSMQPVAQQLANVSGVNDRP